MFKIAISGKAKSGKNTAAKIIESKLSEKLQRSINCATVAFADPMKHMIKTMCPNVSYDVLFGSSELRNTPVNGMLDERGNPVTVRQLLIDLGSMARKYNPNTWIDNFHHRFAHIKDQSDLVILTDCRFQNEFDYLKSQGYYLVRIKRQTDTFILHESETQQDGIADDEFDFVIDNNYDKTYLVEQIEKIVNNLSK